MSSNRQTAEIGLWCILVRLGDTSRTVSGLIDHWRHLQPVAVDVHVCIESAASAQNRHVPSRSAENFCLTCRPQRILSPTPTPHCGLLETSFSNSLPTPAASRLSTATLLSAPRSAQHTPSESSPAPVNAVMGFGSRGRSQHWQGARTIERVTSHSLVQAAIPTAFQYSAP